MWDADVAIVGNGPAGMLAMLACARAGMAVLAIAPTWATPWPARYGLWGDEVDDLPGAVVSHRWEATEVVARSRHHLPRAWALVDAEGTREAWLAEARRLGVRFVADNAMVCDHGVVRAELATWRVGAVVDAAGARSAIAPHPAGSFQCAWGVHALVDAHPFDDVMHPMDWSGDGRTFLHAMPLGRREVFVEETSLLGTVVPFDELRLRLEARLLRMGIGVASIVAEEHRLIPMDVARPGLPGAIAFGAGAGMIHPVSGHLLARVAVAAPRLAGALAESLGDAPATRAARVRRAIWSRDDRLRHTLQRLAAQFLLRLPPPRRIDWFDRFFSAPVEVWRPFLSSTASAREVAASMATLFGRADPFTGARMLLAATRELP